MVSAIGDDLKKVCTSARILGRRAVARRTIHALSVTLCLSAGAKVNIHGRWLLKANVLTRLTDTGLKAKFTPSIALDYAREF